MSSSSVTLRMLPPAGLLARLKRAGTDTGSLRLIERHARAYRRAWLVFISGVFEPLFYLLSVGLGLGVLVGKVRTQEARSVLLAKSRPMCAARPAKSSMLSTVFARARHARILNNASSAPIQTLRWRVIAAASCAGLFRAWRMMARMASGCTAWPQDGLALIQDASSQGSSSGSIV